MERLLSRVDVQIHSGHMWRAKELLRGAIGSGRTEPPVLERYGQVLDSVGDRVEAGKYLFLSGARKSDYEAAIQLFLRRHSRGGPKSLVAQFPTTVRRFPLTDLPPGVVVELRGLGVTDALFTSRKTRAVSKPGPWATRAIVAAVLAAFVLFIIGVIMGTRAFVGWLRALYE